MLNCILFDIDNTLLFKTPSLPEKVFSLVSQGHPEIDMETVERAYAASELWQGIQIKNENDTGVRMSDESYLNGVLAVYAQFLPMDGIDTTSFGKLLAGKCEYSLVPDVLQVLVELKKKSYPLGIVSNNHPEIREVLREHGLNDFFDTIVISEEVQLYKPDPKIIELACGQIGVPCEQTVYVGDHPFDILCAHEAGAKCVWFPPNKFFELPGFISQPEYRIDRMKELNELL